MDKFFLYCIGKENKNLLLCGKYKDFQMAEDDSRKYLNEIIDVVFIMNKKTRETFSIKGVVPSWIM